MTLVDRVKSLVEVTDKLIVTGGKDIATKKEFMEAINAVTGETSLSAVYIMTNDSILCNDVLVVHNYNVNYATFLMDTDTDSTCPFGYSLSVHERCFTKYSTEELVAIILHDIAQNIQSDTAKIRFMKAYRTVTSGMTLASIEKFEALDNFSEILYLMHLQICSHPFKTKTKEVDYVSTDDILRVVDLADAYDNYLDKSLPAGTDVAYDSIYTLMRGDVSIIKGLVSVCRDESFVGYCNFILSTMDIEVVRRLLAPTPFKPGQRFNGSSISFKKLDVPLTESMNNPKSDIEIRYQIDRIINSRRHAENEGEREVILHKIMRLSTKIDKEIAKIDKQTPPDSKTVNPRRAKLVAYNEELDKIRAETVSMDIYVKRWSVYSKDGMPRNYDY